MEITGKIVQILPLQSGQGKNGVWKKQDYIIEFGDQYPKKVCFNLWGDKIDTFAIQLNEQVKVDFDVESREFNGRWYTDVKAWNITKLAAGAPGAVPPTFAPKAEDFLQQAPGEDMPF